MTLSWPEFLTRGAQATAPGSTGGVQLFPCPGATQTVMLCSHIWWTEQIAFAFHQCGYNLIVHPPLYTLYTDEAAFPQFNALWQAILDNLHVAKVDFLIGGNTSAMLVHPQTGELLHEAARRQGRPLTLINWWWDELRTRPPLARDGVGRSTGLTPAEFVALLANEHTVNAIWDIDVKEELAAQLGLNNLFHLPLATLPESWPRGYVPLETRPLAACFLGNCHFTADWIDTDADPLFPWARDIVRRKIADPRLPMQTLITDVTAAHGLQSQLAAAAPASADWQTFSRPMEVLNAAYMHTTRNRFVQAAAAHLGGKLALIGKGWNQLGLRANMEHAAEKSGIIYGQSQVCLNLFGGCVHGGLPLRPYDIGASGGLVTHDQRELPDLFEPNKECLAFSSPAEMIALLGQVRRSPASFNSIAQGARKHVLAEHTWNHRIKKLMQLVSAVH